ncbi:MAG: protein translocase subunit SecD [Gammaproteobacteria bacterium]|nr:MAG: protein translocase subunit SecD [Gammaproteobacteria bacterium]
MNVYPLWKYLMIITLLVLGTLYAIPNLYSKDPSVQISPSYYKVTVDIAILEKVEALLKKKSLNYKSAVLRDSKILLRFDDNETQLNARDAISQSLGEKYNVALNLVANTPAFFVSLNAAPMYLGLDLQGGVHFLIEVDTDEAIVKAEQRYVGDLRGILRKDKVRYRTILRKPAKGDGRATIDIKFKNSEEQGKGLATIAREYPGLKLVEEKRGKEFFIVASIKASDIADIQKFAVQQNITTLRNRVNQLGVAEPIVQQQGVNRIVVQLPGIQDPNKARKILGKAATLEYRAVDTKNSVQEALQGRVPAGSRIYYERNGNPVLLKKRLIVTGDNVVDASSGFDNQTGSPAVYVSLDSKGARRMGNFTRENLQKPMAVVFIETKTRTTIVDGKPKKRTIKDEKVISVATIQGTFSSRFQTTGLDSTEESAELALLLRAGALAAPIEIVEERTIGPSLGKDSIEQGFRSVILGFILVLAFMAIWYRGFGIVANLALLVNLVLIVALLSMLQATLTLPGIAGIVLTVGMAVDANVLIFERIREELRLGNSPQASIAAGYEKALSTIADANITTLLAAIVLFTFGTGPVKGFAVTLSLGIVTSMFTAIMGTRAVVNLVYGGRKRLKKLSI